MNKIDWLKYFAFLLAFIILFLPSETNTLIWLAVLAGILLIIWIFKVYGYSNFLLYLLIIFTVLIFLSEINSKAQKWFIFLGITTLVIWTISYFLKKLN